MAPFRRFNVQVLLFVVLQCSVKLIEAAASVSFQFIQTYASILNEINSFRGQLNTDLQRKYNFTSQEISTIQISSGNIGRILINFDLDIDTRNAAKITTRDTFSRDLSSSSYIFLYTNSTGARAAYLVARNTSSVTPEFWDSWHQFAPDILYAVLVLLAVIALFSLAVYCLMSKRQRGKGTYMPRHSFVTPSVATNSNGVDNDGYVTEMTQVYQIQPAEHASPIPHPSSAPTSPSSDEKPLSPAASMPTHPPPPSSSPSPAYRTDALARPHSTHPRMTSDSKRQSLSVSITPAVRAVSLSVSASPSPSSASKPPSSPRFAQKMAALQGSVRSLPNFFGYSNNTTPTSSRRTSMAEPSMYARLQYASYAVPTKKMYDFI